MATWDSGTEEHICPHCGALHSSSYRDFPSRDRGSQDCLACGQTLIEWTSSRDYFDFKLVHKKRKKSRVPKASKQ